MAVSAAKATGCSSQPVAAPSHASHRLRRRSFLSSAQAATSLLLLTKQAASSPLVRDAVDGVGTLSVPPSWSRAEGVSQRSRGAGPDVRSTASITQPLNHAMISLRLRIAVLRTGHCVASFRRCATGTMMMHAWCVSMSHHIASQRTSVATRTPSPSHLAASQPRSTTPVVLARLEPQRSSLSSSLLTALLLVQGKTTLACIALKRTQKAATASLLSH
jgi:hypothetical protein